MLAFRSLTTYLDYFIANLAPMALAFKFIPMHGGDYGWALTILSGVLLLVLSAFLGLLDPTKFPSDSWRLNWVNVGVLVWVLIIYLVHAWLYSTAMRKPMWTALRDFYRDNYDVRLIIAGLIVGLLGLGDWRILQPLLPPIGMPLHSTWHILESVAMTLLALSLPPREKLMKALMWD